MPLGERSVTSLGGNTPNEKGSRKVQEIPRSLVDDTTRETAVYPQREILLDRDQLRHVILPVADHLETVKESRGTSHYSIALL